MLVEVKEFIENVGYRYFIMNKDSIELIENNSKQVINMEYKKIFNTFIGLLSLSNEWEYSIEDEGIYEITFFEKNKIKKYCFNEVPSNWLLFKAYISVLVGETYE